MTLREKLIVLRDKAGISQMSLAHQLDVSRQAVSRWESGDIPVFIIGVENKRRTGCSLFAFLYRKKARTAGGFQKFSLQER